MRIGTATQSHTEFQPLYPVLKNKDLFNRLIERQAEIAVIGLGYVGLPLAVHMASTFKVKGYDICSEKIGNLKLHNDPCGELDKSEFQNKDITFVDTQKELKSASFFIVAVPTPIDQNKKPNLRPLVSATEIVAKNLSKGDIVVFESTVYPGCTEEVCIPVLEEVSGLQFNKDFFVGYSPERINPGDKEHTFTKITKIVSGSNKQTLRTVAKVYNEVVTAGVHKAPSIKVAEAAKVVENTQRDVNIALMNELSYIFEKAGISINDVLKAAGTKWNFLNFFPGFVGGHCIGVDPYYLIHKAKELDISPHLITASRRTNEQMATHIGKRIERTITEMKKPAHEVTILVKGITFKENVSDIRNSKVINLIRELMGYSLNVHTVDPHASPNEVAHEYRISMVDKPVGKYDAIVIAVAHKEYREKKVSYFKKLSKGTPIIFDLKGMLPSPQKDLLIW